LKANPITAEIPVIFLTAMDQTTDEAEGFAIGAADYIHKPVNPPILKARVNIHVALKKSFDELQNMSVALARANERMESELNMARDIQLSMLPETAPKYREITLRASMVAAREVGGDFYDYFMLNDDELCFCVADVSGKGVPSALFMAIAKMLIKSRATDDKTPSKILNRVNSELAKDNPECMFVTVFLGLVNIRTGQIAFTNAGHNPPLIKRAAGSVDEVSELHGPLVGIKEGWEYGESKLDLAAGDVLLVFTDGVTEALDKEGNLYSDARLLELVQNIDDISADSVLGAVQDSVEKFALGAEQSDDITMISLQYNG
jgi:sigma-B regulation protein RsbU (phosphoserine phosphatase)